MVHSAVLFNPLTCVSLISYYLCVHLSGLQLSSWVTFAQTCVSVPKFADNCVFREYGIIYYWIYWHFLIVNSSLKMDTRGHPLSFVYSERYFSFFVFLSSYQARHEYFAEVPRSPAVIDNGDLTMCNISDDQSV